MLRIGLKLASALAGVLAVALTGMVLTTTTLAACAAAAVALVYL